MLKLSVMTMTAYRAYTILILDSIACLSRLLSQNTSSKHLMLVFALNTKVHAILFNSADSYSSFDGV